MRLLPLQQERPSDFEDGEWIEKPGFPPTDGTWLHLTPSGLPEFEFEEGHDKTKNEPPFRLTIGTHEDAHIRVDDPRIPRRHCMVFKEGSHWYVEALSAAGDVYHGDRRLERGSPSIVTSGDVFSLLRPPTPLAYRIEFDTADNWYLELQSEKDFPNKWPSKMPGHPSESPPAPEELKRLAWQTDQMRRRSEEDQVRVADWAAFSQYVKRHYHKYGIEAKPWRGSVGPPVPRPPEMGPRGYPDWIAGLVADEHLPAYVEREYPFRENLELSGRTCAPSLVPRAPLPIGHVSTWGQSEAGRFKSGGAGVMAGDTTLYAAAMAHGLGHGLGRDAPADSAPSQVAPAATTAVAAPVNQDEPAGPSLALPALQVSFREWLIGMEDAQFVVQYHDPIAAQFDSLGQLADLYVRGGELDDAFFNVVGIKKLGHKRVFQKWFRESLSE